MVESFIKLYNPLNFVAGPGALRKIGGIARLYGTKALFLGSERSLAAAGDRIRQSLSEAGVSYTIHSFSGIPTDQEAESYGAIAKDEGAELVIAAGGGRVCDVAKEAAAIADLPVITAPTITATNASFRRNTIVYNEEGSYIRRELNKESPRYVLADTDILARQPRRYLDSGIIDSLVRLYESEPYHLIYEGELPFTFNYGIAQALYQFFAVNEKDIHRDFAKGRSTPLVEDTVTAIVGLAGIASNYMSHIKTGGFAHPFYNGVTWVNPRRTYLHGEIVGFGILVQLALLGVSESRFDRELSLLQSYGLRYGLAEFGLGHEEIQALARRLYGKDVPRLPFLSHVKGAEQIQEAMLFADRKVRLACQSTGPAVYRGTPAPRSQKAAAL